MRKITAIAFFIVVSVSYLFAQKPAHTFALGDSVFLLDNKPFRMISGEMHYPRIPKEAWRHRMKMAKAMGLNTIGTYVFWNIHEPEKGTYDFFGNHDIAAFVRTAQEEGLWVVLRPSPYVCAEWEFGGYPYWLLKEKDLVVRSMEPKFLDAYRRYIKEVGKQLASLQVNHGGNILMVQVENEYGFYGNDKEYLSINQKLFVEAGFDGLLYTCDPVSKVERGYLPGLLPAINGSDNINEVKELVRKYHGGKGPFYIAEWYPAWFDSWGKAHHQVPAENYTARLDNVLGAGMSINMYMFHGGTTRGFMNGANHDDQIPYLPQVSSYDYDAPLDEAGNATQKFFAFRDVIKKHLSVNEQLAEVPGPRPTISIPAIKLTKAAGLFDILPSPRIHSTPLTFEDLDQAYGFVLYRTTLNDGVSGILKIKELRDYAIIFVNGKRVGVVDRRLNQDSLLLDLPKGNVTLDILVENLGRINFGPYLMNNRKGITEAVFLNNRELKKWKMFSLPFDRLDLKRNRNTAVIEETPVVRQGEFTIQQTGDTYLDMSAWGKGCVWVNGHHLGRYWNIGPQQTIYLPAEWLKKGENEIIILELLKPQQTFLQSSEKPILDVIK